MHGLVQYAIAVLPPTFCVTPFPAALRYNPPMAHDHDTGYKLLFSHPEMVRDLLVGYVSGGVDK
ncbi:MAG: hypothetical protein WC091_23730 [Sulfuricellaceae bacterium]